MAIKDMISALEKTAVFKEWNSKKDNKRCYLSHILLITGENDEYQAGYYNPDNDKVTTFNADEAMKKVVLVPPSEIFKKPGMKVKGIDLMKAKLDMPDSIAISKKLQEEKYPQEKPVKMIIILQDLEQYGMVYNVTFVTHSFKTLNIKVDAESGDIVHEELVSLISFPKKQ